MIRHALVLLALSLLSAIAHAEVIELEGTAKAVDLEAGRISVERKTPKGIKTLDLDVTQPLKATFLRHVRVGAEISLRYNTDLSVITEISLKTIPPMPFSELISRFEVFEPGKPGTQGTGLDQGFVLGYMTAVGEISGEELRGSFLERRQALKRHLAEHPEDGPLPAHVVMVKVLKKEDSGK